MIQFTVFGRPEPQGSTRAFIPKGWKRPIITSANKKQKPWRQQVSRCAQEACSAIQEGALRLDLAFFLACPRSARKRQYPTVKPDIDKLARAILDSLTGIAYRDDAQVVALTIGKWYGTPERVEIRISPAIERT